MNKDEALKMAIEALQNNQTYDWKGNPLTALDEANEKVINACKEALESQEIGDAEIRQMLKDIEYYQKRVEELESQKQEYDINEMIDKITPENLQEPVAWMDENNYVFEKSSDIDDSGEKTPLYTNPAQPLTRDWIGTALERADKDEAFRKGLIGELAQPLSDDEIWAITETIDYRCYPHSFARAIEQALKEKNKC